jgi:protein gp37
MALTPQHRHMVLTKRSARMREYMTALTCDSSFRPYVRRPGWKNPDPRDGDKVMLLNEGQSWPLANVWLGVSVEDQTRADERIPDLLATPAAVRFISAEPLLGPIDLFEFKDGYISTNALTGVEWDELGERGWNGPRINWVIAGGESGPGARPMHPDWARILRYQCAAAGVAFHFKQFGEWHPSDQHEDCDMRSIMAFRADGSQEWRPIEATHWTAHERWQGMCKIGKKRAGRLLDGVTHDGVPAHG